MKMNTLNTCNKFDLLSGMRGEIMGLQIKNETVYVIYRNGEPYNGNGRKLVYTTRGAAQGVITTSAKEDARYNYSEGSWWELSNAERDKLIEMEVEKFKIVEYVPKHKIESGE